MWPLPMMSWISLYRTPQPPPTPPRDQTCPFPRSFSCNYSQGVSTWPGRLMWRKWTHPYRRRSLRMTIGIRNTMTKVISSVSSIRRTRLMPCTDAVTIAWRRDTVGEKNPCYSFSNWAKVRYFVRRFEILRAGMHFTNFVAPTYGHILCVRFIAGIFPCGHMCLKLRTLPKP